MSPQREWWSLGKTIAFRAYPPPRSGDGGKPATPVRSSVMRRADALRDVVPIQLQAPSFQLDSRALCALTAARFKAHALMQSALPGTAARHPARRRRKQPHGRSIPAGLRSILV